MKQFTFAILACVCVTFAVSYFLNVKTSADAMTEGESSMVFTLYKRMKNIEKQAKVRVPRHLKLVINGKIEH